MEAIVSIEVIFGSPPRGRVLVEVPGRELNPTPEELANCPDTFTCYGCAEKRKKSQFAGEILRQRLCKSCAPFADDWTVGGWIHWDLKHGYRTFVRE